MLTTKVAYKTKDNMETEKITIPEEIQQVCRDFAEVAIKHGLFQLSGKFLPKGKWGSDIYFNWNWGRHGDESNGITIHSTFRVDTKVDLTKEY